MENIPSIPNFKLLELCGQGAISTVWIGVDAHGIKRAIRIIDKKKHAKFIEQERKAISAYRNVANQHDNLLDILYLGETPKYLYYVTELADNVQGYTSKYEPDTLAWRIQHHDLEINEILEILDAILRGVAQLHQNKLAHRDLKPENILFVKQVLKIADPGLVSMTTENFTGGTEGYMPPWSNPTGIESDIYAIGIILYILITRQDPKYYPVIPTYCNFKNIRELNEISLKCCESAPAARYHDITQIQQDTAKLRRKHRKWSLKDCFKSYWKYAVLVLLALSLAWNGYLFQKIQPPKKREMTLTETEQLLDYTKSRINSVKINELELCLNKIRESNSPYKKQEKTRNTFAYLQQYVDCLKSFSTEDSSIFLFSLISDSSLFNDKAEQIETMKMFISFNPDCKASVTSNISAYMRMHAQGNEEYAKVFLERLKAIDLSSKNPFAVSFLLMRLANYMCRCENYEEAEYWTNKMEELTPNIGPVLLMKFQLLYKQGHYHEAEKLLHKMNEEHVQGAIIIFLYEILRDKIRETEHVQKVAIEG